MEMVDKVDDMMDDIIIYNGRHNNMLYILLQDPQWQSTSRMINQIILMTTDEHVPLTPTFQKLEMSLMYISNKSHMYNVYRGQRWNPDW